ncbi:hypothetical protein H5410_021835 [Solanum commersonii]|uniref:Uncharacterized protein n=1 Tax=Solanum commersonii TaxID=4109 RepID=A0A9J5ZD36_SOLCO|nr:hypothetical protein H5410_021835 [Solanum commersonii]
MENIKELYAEDGWKINALESNFNEDICNHICNTLGIVNSTEGRIKHGGCLVVMVNSKLAHSENYEEVEKSIEDISKIWEKGLSFPINQLQQIMEEWWKADDSPKLKQLIKVVSIFITWEIWKRRNVMKHGGNMPTTSMILDIHRYIYLFTKSRYPWLKNVPQNWPLIVKYLEGYAPLTKTMVVRWSHPPWKYITAILMLLMSLNQELGVHREQYQNMQELPQQVNSILQQDKEKTPNLRIRKVQTKHYNGT